MTDTKNEDPRVKIEVSGDDGMSLDMLWNRTPKGPSQFKTEVSLFDGIPIPDVPIASDWTIPQAYLCLLLSTVMADSRTDPIEIDFVRSLARRSNTFRNFDEDQLTELNREVLRRISDKERPNHIEEACRALPKEYHPAVFAQCFDVALSDNDLPESERRFLDSIVRKLAIQPETARKIMEVIALKNYY